MASTETNYVMPAHSYLSLVNESSLHTVTHLERNIFITRTVTLVLTASSQRFSCHITTIPAYVRYFDDKVMAVCP